MGNLLLTTSWVELPGRSGEDRIFAIGDVHCRSDLLKMPLEFIRLADPTPTVRVIFLGDLIDRGPNSVHCLDLVLRLNAERPDCVHLLWGNHEIMLADALRDLDTSMDFWLWNGGRAVISELGLDAIRDRGSLAQQLRRHLPAQRLFEDGPWETFVSVEDLLFVHAGINPRRGISTFLAQPPFTPEDTEEHWAWVRRSFLEWEGGWQSPDRVIVRGHTPVTEMPFDSAFEVALRSVALGPKRRIALDGGAGRFPHGQVLMGEFFSGKVRVHSAAAT